MIYDPDFDANAEGAHETVLAAIAEWLSSQPQDVWLMFVKCMNYDFMTEVVKSVMLDNPDCDLAIVAWFFWNLDPAYGVESREDWTSGSDLIRLILGNLDRGYYQTSELGFNRLEVIFEVQSLATALETRAKKGLAPITGFPRRLLGPFPGRTPDGSHVPAEQLSRFNAVIEKFCGGLLEPSNRAWQEAFESNHWIRHYLRLPSVAAASDPALYGMDLSEHIAAIYGSRTAFDKARRQLANDLPYLGRRKPRSLFSQLRWQTRSARGNRQYYDGV
ncbi:MAG: DUF4274 domain-containing protein [Hyphomonas sp.]